MNDVNIAKGTYSHNKCEICGVPHDGTEAAKKSDPPKPFEGGHSELSPSCPGRPPGHPLEQISAS